MPFINSKVTVKISNDKKQELKTRLGKAISIIPGKSESWLMLGFEDNYDLYFKGNQSGETAFIEVKIFGSASPAAYAQLTDELCAIYNEELNIPMDRIYVKYEEVEYWGWNGNNF